MKTPKCAHRDVRRFDNVHCCLECGETLFLSRSSQKPGFNRHTEDLPFSRSIIHLYDDIRLSIEQKIRLIILAPGEFEDPVWCTVLTVDLDPIPEYEALSYTWATEDGNSEKIGRIHCPLGVIPVTENCEVALRTLRLSTNPRTLWVDAICINQENLAERSHQVGLMDQIYSKASEVQVMIHDPSRSYSQGLCFLRGERQHRTKGIAQLKQLFSRRYFSRVWIIQEILLAQSIIIHVNGNQFKLSKASTNSIRSSFDISEFKLPRVLDILTKGTRVSTKKYLELSMNAECTDPRDGVYGIVSLLDTKSRQLIPVDYSLSLTEVIASAVVACIAECENLSILACLCRKIYQGPRQDITGISLFDINNFRSYLSATSQEFWIIYSPALQQAENRPWSERVRVPLPHELQTFQSAVAQNVHKPIVQMMSTAIPLNQIFPRLRVRAHLIDISQGPTTVNFDSLHAIQREQDFGMLQVEPSDLPKSLADRFRIRVTDSLFHVSQEDIREFTHELNDLSLVSSRVFFTNYSIGFSAGHHLSGDHVFAIDGLSHTMLLRPVSPGVYRPVNLCHIWAAMDLDYWYPGTHKGLWPDRPVDLGEQTRMIELY